MCLNLDVWACPGSGVQWVESDCAWAVGIKAIVPSAVERLVFFLIVIV